MFQKGEYVYHESGGICKIDEICAAPLSGMPTDRLYYVMKPIHDRNSINYVPVDSNGVFVRRLLDRSAAGELLEQIPSIEPFCEPNAKLLRLKYLEAMRSHQPAEWARVIRTVCKRMQSADGKLIRVSDSERGFMEAAKRNLLTELAMVLDEDAGQIECAVLKNASASEA